MTKLLFDFRHAAEVRGTDGLARLRSLPSFHAHYRALAKGARIPKTTEWLCCGGVIYLVHDEPAQIDDDIARIRAWEQRGALYELAPLETELEAVS